MALITINGAELPDPTDYNVDETPIGRFERNANGRLVGDLIGVKARLMAGWKMMGDADFQRVLTAARAHFVNLTYYDPFAGARVTKQMAVNARSGRLAYYETGGKWWGDVSVEFVEV